MAGTTFVKEKFSPSFFLRQYVGIHYPPFFHVKILHSKAVISLSVCASTHVRIGTLRMFLVFFFSDGHLCFFLILFVILLAGGVSSVHVRMCACVPPLFFIPPAGFSLIFYSTGAPFLLQYPLICHASKIHRPEGWCRS